MVSEVGSRVQTAGAAQAAQEAREGVGTAPRVTMLAGRVVNAVAVEVAGVVGTVIGTTAGVAVLTVRAVAYLRKV